MNLSYKRISVIYCRYSLSRKSRLIPPRSPNPLEVPDLVMCFPRTGYEKEKKEDFYRGESRQTPP